MLKLNWVWVAAVPALACACATNPQASNSVSDGMVVAAHPEATEAGLSILRAGGSAVDAAVAIEATLSLVEPQSSGFGGGAFMVHYEAETGDITVYDGRETAPAGATPDMFLTDDGEPWGYLDAKHSGVSIGAPSVVPMLALAHDDHGALAWDELFSHAIDLSEEGFEVTPRLGRMIERFGKYLPDDPNGASGYLKADGTALVAGDVLRNPDYADTLRAIASNPRALHEGAIAEAIVDAAQAEPRAGTLSLADLTAYEARRVEPICTPYRDMTVCGAPPPSSGGIAIGMVMGLIEAAGGMPSADADDPAGWALLTEAQRLMYADRDRYVADADFVDVPIKGLLASEYLAERAALISADTAIGAAKAGDPWAHNGSDGPNAGADATLDTPGTTHFVVVDKAGNVVSMTATVESIFGSARMAGGMMLNNQLTDFSFKSHDEDGAPIANAVAPGKRPRSSMSPVIVLDADGEFLLATGSPGGNSIIAYVAKNLVGVLDWGLSPQEATALPNLVARGDKVRIETPPASAELLEALRAYGLELQEREGENSGVHTVLRHPDGTLEGGADRRREGVVGVP